MKQLKLLILIMLISATAFAQSVGINSDGSTPDASAMLDVKSTSKGFLAPRVSSTGDVTSPATGLLVYQTSVPSGYYFYNGTNWLALGVGDYSYNSNERSLYIGQRAGNSDNGKDGNTGIGTDALYENQSYHNTAIGCNALVSNEGWGSYGYGNIALGYAANQEMENYNETLALGYYTNASGNNSIAIGSFARVFEGDQSIAIGYSSEIHNSYNSIVLGYNSNIVSNDNSIIIGNDISSTSDNEIILGNSSNNRFVCSAAYNSITPGNPLYVNSDGEIGYQSSSKRYKTNIKDMEDVSWLYDLRPVNFRYKTDSLNSKQYGLIAEEVVQVNPEFVFYKDNKIEGVLYSNLITPLLKEAQKKNKEIETLKAQIAALSEKVTELDQLRAEIENLKKAVYTNTQPTDTK